MQKYNGKILTYVQELNSDSKRGGLMLEAYNLLITGKVIRMTDILAKYYELSVEQYLKQEPTPSNDAYYRELKYAINNLVKLLEWKCGKECVLISKDPENKQRSVYQYIGKIKDPLYEERLYTQKLAQEDYVAFCESADGFMPDDWFTYFFQRSPIPRDNRKKKIQSGANSIQKNIKMLPDLFDHIQKHHVLKIAYTPFVQEECTVIFHPHYLKEYNGRWYVYGQGRRVGIDDKPISAFSMPLDRIEGVLVVTDYDYIPAEPGFYEEYFRNIIGVSHGFYDGKEIIPMGRQDVVIRVHDRYMYGLVTTKKFHRSQQETLDFGLQADGLEYGEITLFGIEPNNELIGKILQMGVNIEVVQPIELRNKIKKDLRTLLSRYG